MSWLFFLFWSAFILWLGFLFGQWWFGDRLYPYRMKCNGECYEDVPFRIASNEVVFVRQALTAHLESQHE